MISMEFWTVYWPALAKPTILLDSGYDAKSLTVLLQLKDEQQVKTVLFSNLK